MTYAELQHFIGLLQQLVDRYPIVSALLVMMLLDIFSGFAVAIGTKTVSSTISWRGMCKKSITLTVVGAAAVLTPFANGLPLHKLVAICFIVSEFLSIAENAGLLGVPLPAILTDTLEKLRADAEAKRGIAKTTVVLIPPNMEARDAIDANTAATVANTAAQVSANFSHSGPQTPPANPAQ